MLLVMLGYYTGDTGDNPDKAKTDKAATDCKFFFFKGQYFWYRTCPKHKIQYSKVLAT